MLAGIKKQVEEREEAMSKTARDLAMQYVRNIDRICALIQLSKADAYGDVLAMLEEAIDVDNV